MKIPASILTFIMVQATFYLFGSFIANSFDLSQWNTDGRFMCAMLSFICGFALAAITYTEIKKGEK